MSAKLYYNNIQQQIQLCLKGCSKNLRVAVAWMTNHTLFKDLLSCIERGIKVELIILNDTINFRRGGLDFQKFIDSGGILHISTLGKKLHHKFCIVDNEFICTGSYNWTYRAEHNNHENLLIIKGDNELCTTLLQAFRFAQEDAIQIEQIARFHEMYPPTTAVQEIECYSANDLAESIIDISGDLSVLTDVDFTILDSTLKQRLIDSAEKGFDVSLKESNKKTALKKLLLLYHNWTVTELRQFKELIDISILLKNENFIWSLKHINELTFTEDQQQQLWRNAKFEDISNILRELSDQILWQWLSMNINIKWTNSLLKRYAQNINWKYFAMHNQNIFWNELTIDAFAEYLDWKKLSTISNVDWSSDLIEKYDSRLDFGGLSQNNAIPWSSELYEEYRNRWNHKRLSANNAFCWTEHIVIAAENLWDWQELYKNESMCWNTNLIRRYHQKYHKSILFENKGINWTIDMLNDLSDWLDIKSINYYNGWGAISHTDGNWKTAEIMELFQNKLYIGYVSYNKNVDWPSLLQSTISKEFFRSYQFYNTVYTGLTGLVSNPSFPWTEKLIMQHIEPHFNRKSFLNDLLRNSGFKKTKAFIDKYSKELNLSILSYVANVEWSVELYEVYANSLNGDGLSKNQNLLWNPNILGRTDLNWEHISNNKAVFDMVLKPSLNPFIIHAILTEHENID